MSTRSDEVAELVQCRELYRQFTESIFDGEQLRGTGVLRRLYAGLMADLIAFVEAVTSTDERPCVLMIKPNGEKDSQFCRRAFKSTQRCALNFTQGL